MDKRDEARAAFKDAEQLDPALTWEEPAEPQDPRLVTEPLAFAGVIMELVEVPIFSFTMLRIPKSDACVGSTGQARQGGRSSLFPRPELGGA